MESRELCSSESRNKDSELLSGFQALINLDVVKEILSALDIPTVEHASETVCRAVTARIVSSVSHA